MDTMPRHIVEDTTKAAGPPTWNYLLRPGVFATANVTEFTLLAGAAAGKAAVEYGALKLPFYVLKAPFALGCNIWDSITAGPAHPLRNWNGRLGPGNVNHRARPQLTRGFRWGDPNRTRAGGNSDRPNWLNWFWNPEDARDWGPQAGGGATRCAPVCQGCGCA